MHTSLSQLNCDVGPLVCLSAGAQLKTSKCMERKEKPMLIAKMQVVINLVENVNDSDTCII